MIVKTFRKMIVKTTGEMIGGDDRETTGEMIGSRLWRGLKRRLQKEMIARDSCSRR